jgi:hypothetical protein
MKYQLSALFVLGAVATAFMPSRATEKASGADDRPRSSSTVDADGPAPLVRTNAFNYNDQAIEVVDPITGERRLETGEEFFERLLREQK